MDGQDSLTIIFSQKKRFLDLVLIDFLRGFGAWPIAKVSANKQKVMIEGPVCDSSEVLGWHLKKMNNWTDSTPPPPLHISSFAFNSSILWDPERWGRTSSVQDSSQARVLHVRFYSCVFFMGKWFQNTQFFVKF